MANSVYHPVSISKQRSPAAAAAEKVKWAWLFSTAVERMIVGE